jgi:hypothetical protein
MEDLVYSCLAPTEPTQALRLRVPQCGQQWAAQRKIRYLSAC